jgi:8-oxo-dGTP pyrophosphatase MutT (NUDIX family)
MALQSAAIPYRRSGDGRIEVLLVTSRRQGRWVFPKGKVKPGIPPHIAAASEAYEEAGVIGLVYANSVGEYAQTKINADGTRVPLRIRAYSMAVADEAAQWPEMYVRRRSWMTLAAATIAVGDPELQKVLAHFQAFALSTLGPNANDGIG